MFSSSTIPTVGKASPARAVESVLAETLTADDLEVIAVNDSGEPLPHAARQDSPRGVTTNRRECSFARNTNDGARHR